MSDLNERRKRLTHDDPQGMVESLFNTAFVKDQEVYLRKVGKMSKDISLCEYCADKCNEMCGVDLSNIGVDEFSDHMDCKCPVTLLYFIAIGAAEMREKLKGYEDKEGLK